MQRCARLMSIRGWIVVGLGLTPGLFTMPGTAQELSKTVADLLGDHVGAAVRVIDNGAVVFDFTDGVTRLENGEPVTAATNFRLASVTKQFTAFAVLLLADRGALDLDDTLDTFFPGFPAYGRDITVRQLLLHRSGLPDYEDLIPDGTTLQLYDLDALQLLMDTDAPDFPAGQRFAYSNSGYVLLGLIVEQASGRPFHTFLREEVFEPAGMAGTVMYVRGLNAVPRRAYGHTKDDAGQWTAADQSLTSALLGDGGIYSSLDDLARWVALLDAQRILSAQGYETLYAAQPTPQERDGDAAMGWFVDTRRGQRRLYHGGSTRGFRSMIQRYPDRNAAVILLLNGPTETPTDALCEQIADLTLFAPDGSN